MTDNYIIKCIDKFFCLHDSKGDDNCFNHSIVSRGAVGNHNTTTLRISTMETIKGLCNTDSVDGSMVKLIFSAYSFEGTLMDWCDTQMKDGEWASTLDITFVAFVHKVNIISISNLIGKSLIFDTCEH